MPSSMIFVGLVVIWLLILVPAVARHRQEVARPSVAALSGRVLERPRRRQNLEVDVMDDLDQSRPVATRPDDEAERPQVPAARTSGARVPAARAEVEPRDDLDRDDLDRDDLDRDDLDRDDERAAAGSADDEHADDEFGDSDSDSGGIDDDSDIDDGTGDGDPDDRDAAVRAGAEDWADEQDWTDEQADDDRRWERPPPRYRPGRGGFDPEAAAMTARARYAFRQRVVLAMLVVALITAVVAAVAVPGVWWLHIAVDLVLVGYLVYLRRQVRMEEAIRERRAARMAGTRRPGAAEDPELDEWARRGREASRTAEADDRRPVDPADGERWVAERDADVDADANADDGLAYADDLDREAPERVPGTGASVRAARLVARPAEEAEPESALPRLQPAPPPPLPAGTALVEVDDEDPALHELDGPVRPDYRRAVGE